MKTNLFKTSIVAIALLASGGAHAFSINSLYKDYMITFTADETIVELAEVEKSKF